MTRYNPGDKVYIFIERYRVNHGLKGPGVVLEILPDQEPGVNRYLVSFETTEGESQTLEAFEFHIMPIHLTILEYYFLMQQELKKIEKEVLSKIKYKP